MRKPQTPTIGSYAKAVNDGLAKLQLAITYAEDGAPLDAARCASEGVIKMLEASSLRAWMLEAQKKVTMPIAEQHDAALVAAMAERTLMDIQILRALMDAGCSDAECRAAMKGEVN